MNLSEFMTVIFSLELGLGHFRFAIERHCLRLQYLNLCLYLSFTFFTRVILPFCASFRQSFTPYCASTPKSNEKNRRAMVLGNTPTQQRCS